METPYPSQLALAASNSSTGAANSNSSNSRLSSGTSSSSTSTIDELRSTRHCNSGEPGEGSSEGGASQREAEYENGMEQGSSARPRTMLRRSRTTNQVERRREVAQRERRASAIALSLREEQDWVNLQQFRTEEGVRKGEQGETVDEEWSTLEPTGLGITSPLKANFDETVQRNPIPSPTTSAHVPTLPLLPIPASALLPPHSEPLNRTTSLPAVSSCPSTPASSAQAVFSSTSLGTLPPSNHAASQSSQAIHVVDTTPHAPPYSRHRRSTSLPLPSSSARRVSRAPLSNARHNEDSSSTCSSQKGQEIQQGSTFFASEVRASSSNARKASHLNSSSWIHPVRLSDLAKMHAMRLGGNGNTGSSRLVVAPLTPPISMSTLHELDLQEVMRNAQLRHDVVFDPSLMFRPNFDGERGDRKRVAAEQYWSAVSREITQGCRCSAFVDCEVLPCICTRASTSSSTYLISAAQLPSRVTPLVAELRGILLSLLPATGPASPTPPSIAVFETVPHSNGSAPIYGPREQLIDALDPTAITEQLAAGRLDVGGLARFLGTTLQTHCAPMRDEAVDEMVAAFEGGEGVVSGLRMCFEILELMKLDIANHQLRALRPLLLQTSVEFERRFFDSVYSPFSSVPSTPRLGAWFSTAFDSLKSKKENLPQTSSTLLDQIVAHGVLDLVFSPSPAPSSSLASPQGRPSSFDTLPETLQLDSFRLGNFHGDVTDLTIVYMLSLLYQQLSSPARPSASDIDTVRHELWCIISANTGALPSFTPVNGIPSVPGGQGVSKLEDQSWRSAMQDAVFQVAVRAQQAKLNHSSPSSAPSTLPTPDQQLVSLAQGYFDANARSDSKVYQLLSKRLREAIGVCVDEVLEKEKKRGDDDFLRWWTDASEGVKMRTGHRRIPVAAGGGGGSSSVSSSNMMAPSAPSRGTKRSHSEESEGPPTVGIDGEKRQRIDRTSSISKIHLSHSTTSRFESTLTRNGLGSLTTEIKVLGDRIAKVASYNLCVFRPLYTQLLAELLV